MALTTYTNPNITNDPYTYTAIDTGVGSAPADRSATFTPAAGYTAPSSVGVASFGSAGNDWSMNTTPSVRPKCFEPGSFTASIDPGLGVNG